MTRVEETRKKKRKKRKRDIKEYGILSKEKNQSRVANDLASENTKEAPEKFQSTGMK